MRLMEIAIGYSLTPLVSHSHKCYNLSENMLLTAGDVERIWSRPDQSSSQIISVGSSILDPEQASLFALESDGTLIILSASPALEGAYQCRIATQVKKGIH